MKLLCNNLVSLQCLTEHGPRQLCERSMSFKTTLLLLLTVCSCQSLLCAKDSLDKEIADATMVAKHQEAPDFTCQTTDGKNITLSALKGKVVVLYFFSMSALPASLAEMRYLERDIFQPLRKREDFRLIAIGRGHSREELVKLSGENKLNFSMVPDPKKDLFGRFFSKFVPRTVVVGKDGKTAQIIQGHHEYDGIIRLQAMLKQQLDWR